MIRIEVPMEFDESWLLSVVCSALEGGSSYWLNDGFVCSVKSNEEGCVSELVAEGKAKIKVTDVDDVIAEGEFWCITRRTFIEGYKRYCQWCIETERDIYTDAGMIDAEIGDIILQLGLFNEIIFG